MNNQKNKHANPPQYQERQPGVETAMKPRPEEQKRDYKGSDKLRNKVALITGGDSGIGAATAIAFAKEGADVVIVYKEEHEDAENVRRQVEQEDRRCLLIAGDVKDEDFCIEAVERTVKQFKRIDILINNAAEQHKADSIEELDTALMEETFRTNIFSMFYFVKAALKYMKEGSTIINTASITAYEGNPSLLDYSATKGAIVAFTRALSKQLVEKGIRVNAVAPGPVWTPLIPASFPPEKIESFGTDTPMGRPAQPSEIAPCYVFLASEDSSYMAGQVLHPNGGKVVNG